MSDQYQWWRDAIAGKAGEIHADHPQSGYFKIRDGKDGPWVPVAIWKDAVGDLKCRVAARSDDALRVWTWAAKNPVSKADAKHAFEHGAWPGDAATIGDNSAHLGPLEKLRDYIETARAWFSKAGEIKTQTACDQAANYAAELIRLKGEADRERDAKVRPHLDAQRDINGAYKPAIEDGEALAKQIKRASDGFLIAEKRRLEDEARAKYEAERKAAEAARIAAEKQRATLMADDPIAALTTPAPELPAMPAAPEPVKVSAGGQRGRKLTLRRYTVYTITDFAAALGFAKDSDEVFAAVEKVCFAAAKAGVKVPGVTVTQEERAA